MNYKFSIQKKYAYQDVLAKQPNICSEVAAKDNKEVLPRNFTLLDAMGKPLQIDVATNARHSSKLYYYCCCFLLFI